MIDIFLAFITGLTTGGLSCLAVQGGLLASSVAHEVEQSVRSRPPRGRLPAPKPRAARPILLFLGAKLAAYTVLGLLLGLLGSVLQLTSTMRAVMQAAVGIFMVGTALRMLNVHPIFRYFALEPPPAVTRYIRRRSKGEASAVTPLFLGALTVFIPCGVTQAMMAVAIGTANPAAGAAIMAAFILGTSPVFFAVAYLATRLGARLEASFMRLVAVVVLLLGLLSVDTGLTLAGWPYSFTNLRMGMAGESSEVAAAPASAVQATRPPHQVPRAAAGQVPPPASLPVQPAAPAATPAQPAAPGNLGGLAGPALAGGGAVTITARNNGYVPTMTRARAGQPFRLVVLTKDTSSCARAFVVPSLGIQRILPVTGSVVIDVPAQQAGSRLFFTCSMGMYSGVIAFDG